MSTLGTQRKSTARTARLGIRATPRQQMLILSAAEAVNKSVTEFILQSACEAAENTLLNQRFFLLNDEEWKGFQEILERPVMVKPGLKKLLRNKTPWE
ncbi:MAG: DUF1778 domain-containing protein [Acidobacteria bacterium]|jgi:uncharacterized protein (DUF1778 family)|nr:DUF1778 domain-containing protein [Acidobacteriota bacterium]